MGRTQRSNNNASCQDNELSGSIGGTHPDVRGQCVVDAFTCSSRAPADTKLERYHRR